LYSDLLRAPGDEIVRRTTVLALVAMGIAATGMVAKFTGFIEGRACVGTSEMKGNASCAKSCIKGGSRAVFVTEDGTVYKIANQAKIASHAGENVIVTGDLRGDTLTIESVK
jgi:hypothetical protein